MRECCSCEEGVSVMSKSLRAVLGFAIGVVAFVLVPANGASANEYSRVLLDGRPAPLSLAASKHCIAQPSSTLVCFSRAAQRDRVFQSRLASTPLSATATGYVIAYQDSSYLGASVVLAQNYTNLGTIGWSDRISSYRVYTSLTGYFYQNSGYSGAFQSYCCFWQIPYVGNSFNDTFTSFELP